MITTGIIIAAILLLVGLTMWWLITKQVNFVTTLQPGDKISYNGTNGEILDKIDSNTFIVRLEVKGMTLAPPVKPKRKFF